MSGADGSNPIPLTDFHARTTFAPSWSPDGKELVFASMHGPGGSKSGVFVLNVESRDVRRLTDDAYSLPSWSRDGRWIYLASSPFRGADGIWRMPAAGGEPVLVAPLGGLLAQESPDGRSLYYMKYTGGIWKVPVEGGEETAVLPGFGAELRGYWRVADDGIYYLHRGAQPAPTIEFFDFATCRSHHLVVFTGNYAIFAGGLTVSPDRRWIVYAQGHPASNEIMLVENFR
jgi:Tol biopolymer transport system component